MAQSSGCGLFAQFVRFPRILITVLSRPSAKVPLDLQLSSRGLRCPPTVRHDRHASLETGSFRNVVRVRVRDWYAVDDESMLNALHSLDGVEIRADHLATQNGCLLKDRIQHTRDGHINSEDRLTDYQVLRLDADSRCTNDLVIFWVLQLERSEVRR